MKRLTYFLSLVLISIVLTGCSGGTTTSETGYDLTALEECIDAMVEDNSNQACTTETKNTLLEEYATSFMDEYSGTATTYSKSDLTYSQSKDGSIERIEFWFQFTGLPADLAETEYESFKAIIQTMSTELRAMNSVPEFIFSGEFLFLDDYAYKYHHDLNDDISGEIIVWGLLSTFTETFAANKTFLQSKLNDEDLISQEYIIVTGDHNVSIEINNVTSTYSYNIYYSNPESLTTITEVETDVESLFVIVSFTQE